jgi:hypothetical protein
VQYGLVEPAQQAWASLAARAYRFRQEHHERLLNVMVRARPVHTQAARLLADGGWGGVRVGRAAQVHHGSMLDLATVLRDVIVAEQVLDADRLDLAALQARVKAEARSQGANAAYVCRARTASHSVAS